MFKTQNISYKKNNFNRNLNFSFLRDKFFIFLTDRHALVQHDARYELKRVVILYKKQYVFNKLIVLTASLLIRNLLNTKGCFFVQIIHCYCNRLARTCRVRNLQSSLLLTFWRQNYFFNFSTLCI